MPRIRWTALAVGTAIALTTVAEFAPAQEPRPRPAPRRGDPDRPDRKATKGEPDPADAAPDAAPAPRGRPDRGRPGRGRPESGKGDADLPGSWGPASSGSLSSLRETLINQPAPLSGLLLALPPIQKELKLTSKQVSGITEIARGIEAERRNMRRAAAQDNMTVDPEELLEARIALLQEREEAFTSYLQPHQYRRLNQIALQIEGPLAIAKPDIAQRLNLGPAQLVQVQDILDQRKVDQDDIRAQRREIITTAGAPDLMAARFRELDRRADTNRDRAIQKIARLLTKKQKADFNKMLGEPFDLTLLEGSRPAKPGPKRAAPEDAADPDMDKPATKGKAATRDRATTKGKPAATKADDEEKAATPADEAPRPRAPRPRGASRRVPRAPDDEGR